MRPQLFKLSEEEHALLVVMHEITFDLWSVRTVLRDLRTLYEGFLAGEAQPLEPLPVQIGDWARAESAALERTDMREHEAYWRETLAGDLPVLDLPLDRVRPEQPTNHGAAHRVLLPADLSKRLVELSRREDATLFMVLLASWAGLLRHYTGQDDIIVGAPLAKRNYEETEKLVGFFLNMLPLRVDLSEDPTFRELVASVRGALSGAVTHADYPFARMLEWARAARDPRFSPMFQVMFNMMAYTDESLQDGSLEIAYSGLETGFTKYDLSLYAQEHGERIHLQISYLKDLFEDESVERMLHHLVALLESFAANPDARLSEAVLHGDAEHISASTLGEAERSYGDGASIYELFERQVTRSPDATALHFGEQRITYAELNTRASRLGGTLHEAGVAPGTLVAVSVDRSIDTLVALLGILKAGGTYVALDPTYPRRRLEDILDDTRPAFLVAQPGLEDFQGYDGIRVILDDAMEVEGPPADLPTCATDLADPLMVVYTSSSTGKPKGVPIPQSAVLNRLYWMWETYPFKDGDVAVLHKSTALVASTWECFGALLQGIPTVVLSRDEQLDPGLLFERVVAHGVTHFLATPSMIRGVLDQAERNPEAWRTLRLGTTSAEPIEPEMVMRWRECFPDAPLLNLYGATECSSNATVYDTSQLLKGARRVPIGRPLTNVRVHVLDEHLRPVPTGVAGEMCVSGACLGAGYHDLPELTAERFIENPIADDPGSVLYRTGDIARLLPDGNLELLGRRDLQVKVRGFRVDIGDVESALKSHAEVADCGVALRGRTGAQELVAYVVSSGSPTAPSLRRHLRERLPSYMVPAEFAFVASLPRTPNGKLDRRALPTAMTVTRERDDTFVAPRSDLEVRVARIFEATLEVEPIGTNDDFFELGGHSLLAVRVVDRVEASFGRRIPLPTLFQEPTVAGVARALCEEGAPDIQSALVPLREGEGTPLFCISGIALYRSLAQHLPGTRPVYGIYLEDELTAVQIGTGPAPERFPEIQELAKGYVTKIREAQTEGPYALAGVSFGGFLAYEIAQQLRAGGADVALLALLDSSWPDAVRRSGAAFVKNALRRIADEGPAEALSHAARRLLGGDRSHVKLRAGAIDLQEQRAVAFRRVVRSYAAEPYPGRVALFRANDREMPAGYEMDPLLGWESLVTGELQIRDVPGSHLGILEEPNVETLAAQLGDLLDE
jgi:amino acid adenylation domain-containing protein